MSSRKEEREEALVELWQDRIRLGFDAKKDFDKAAKEVDDLFTGEPDPFFKSEAFKEFLDLTHCPQITINVPFQIRSWLGPNLYQRNPTRTVTSRTKDSILSALGAVIQAWLNYTPGETNLADESRLAVDEALLSARSCAYTGFDKGTGLITSRYVSIDDVVIDPDARRVKDAYWIAVRRRLPRWHLEREFKSAVKDLPEDIGADTLSEGTQKAGTSTPRPRDGDEEPTDVVTFYEVYSKMGTGWRGSDHDEELGGDDSFDFKKIVIVDGYPKPLFLGRWETPLYVDGVWPLTFLDLTPTKNRLYPVSLIKAALPSLRAVNFFATVAAEKAKQHAREVYGVAKGLPDEDKEALSHGGLSVMIELESTDPGTTLQQMFQRWEGGQISPEIREQINFHLAQIGEVTGLLPILKGQSSEQQIRSATEADIQDRNARSRLQDLSERVEDWATRIARNEGLLCRLEMDAEEVSKYLDASTELELGYRLLVPSFGVPLPTRLYAPGSEVDPEKEEPCLQGLAPAFARYYPTPEAAQEALMLFLGQVDVLQQVYLARTGKVIFVDRDDATGAFKCSVERVTVKDVWTDTAYLGPTDLAREISFRIEAGSTKRPDANKKIDQANTLMASVGQPALQMMDVETYNDVLEAVYESQQTPPAMRIKLKPPPTPDQNAGQAPPPGPPKGAPKR